MLTPHVASPQTSWSTAFMVQLAGLIMTHQYGSIQKGTQDILVSNVEEGAIFPYVTNMLLSWKSACLSNSVKRRDFLFLFLLHFMVYLLMLSAEETTSYVGLNGRIAGEHRLKTRRNRRWSNFRRYPGICPGRLTKTTKQLIQNSRFSGPKLEPGISLLRRSSFTVIFFIIMV
jgi:hypothetical protein